MKRGICFVLAGWLGMSFSFAGTPTEASSIRTKYEQDLAVWKKQVEVVASAEARAEIWKKRPDATAAARQMWTCIQASLDQEWALEPAAWFLRLGVGLPSAAGDSFPHKELELVRSAVETKHVRSPRLSPMCLSLVSIPDPRSIAILEKIESGNPDPKVQGVAALSLALVLKNLGDEGDVMRRRLQLIRKAIINSADVEVEGVTIASLAEDELYVIRYLQKGRMAPDLVGKDLTGKPISLEDYKDKVVVLMFWGAWNDQFDQISEITRNLQQKLAAKGVVLLGVNNDSTATLQQLVKERVVTWTNIVDTENKLAKEYRIRKWPAVFVLDSKRTIRYIGAPGSFVDLTVDAVLAEK